MASDRRVGVVAGVAALLSVAVVGAAVAAPWRLEPRNWHSPDIFGRPGAMPTPLSMPSTTPGPVASRPHPLDLSWVGAVAFGLAVLLSAFGLWLLWRRYRRSAVEQRRARQVGDVLVLPSTPEVPVLRRGVVAAQRSLDEIADPNNAIVAAWLALEEAAASSGVRRERAETPTEFTVDILQSTRADPSATRELLALYHRARFSTAGVSRSDVAAASRCLGELARSWDAMTVEAVNTAVGSSAAGASAAEPRPRSSPPADGRP